MNTPEEKLKKVEGTLKQLEDNLMKLNDEYDAKKAEIDAIANIKNSRLQVKNWRGESIKEKKALSTKIFGIFGGNKENTTRRLTDAKKKLKQRAYSEYLMKVDEIQRLYKQYTNLKEQIELEIQRGKERREVQEKASKYKEEVNKIEKQKSDLIARYSKLGYTYIPKTKQYTNPCEGMSQQAIEYGGCDRSQAIEVDIPYTDSFQYITETKEKPTDGDWKEEKQKIIVPAKYEKRLIPGTQGNYGYQGYGTSNTYENVKVADEREEVVSVWKRDLPAGFPAKVEYNDFLTVIEQLESKPKNVQSRKRKQNRRKSMKARKN